MFGRFEPADTKAVSALRLGSGFYHVGWASVLYVRHNPALLPVDTKAVSALRLSYVDGHRVSCPSSRLGLQGFYPVNDVGMTLAAFSERGF